MKKAVIIIIIILLIDQWSKIYIKTHFVLGDDFKVLGLDWFRIHWLYSGVKSNGHKILIVAIAFIFAGALGNIIDSVFYGVLFGDSHGTLATFLPEEGGYGTLFHGKVVDLFYFPIVENAQLPSWIPEINFNWPDWIPGIGGNNFSLFVDRNFTFFQYIFNVADASITAGVGLLLIFNKKVFPKKEKVEEPKNFIEPPVVVTHYEKPKS